MASLSFDVLKWLNTLELKKVPRNLKHDISTGHVVAEIISRYFRDSCTVLDLSEGHIPRDRRENWLYIERCLRNIDFPFPEDWSQRAAAVCEESEGAQAGACAILTYLYEFTTKKTARHPTRCDKLEISRQSARGSGWTTARAKQNIPIVTKVPSATNPVITTKERDRQYQAQFVNRLVGFAEIAQATLTFLQKSFLDMDTTAYISMVEQACDIQDLSGVAYDFHERVQHNVYMRKKYIQVAEEACFMPDLTLESIINDVSVADESIRTIFHVEYLQVLSQKVALIVDAASLSLEAELFVIFAFCSTYSMTLSTLVFGALQRFLTILLTSLLQKLKEDNLQSTRYLDFVVHSLFSYLPTSLFVANSVSYKNFYDPVTLTIGYNDIYGTAIDDAPVRNFFALSPSIGYMSSPITAYSILYPPPSYNTAEQIGPIEFVAHCIAIVLSIFPRSGVILLNNHLFSLQPYSEFESACFSSKDYLATQIEGATEEYNVVKQISPEKNPISSLTQQKLAFLLATLKSLSKLQLSSVQMPFEDLMKLLEYFSFFANQAFVYKTNNTRPNNFAITRTCAGTRDCAGLCTQIWSEICQLLASYLNQYSDLKTSVFESLILDCDEGSKSILSILVRSTQNMQRMLTGLSVKQLRKLASKIYSGGDPSRGLVASARRSASGRLPHFDSTVQRSAVVGSSLSIFRKAVNAPPRREPQLTSLTSHISLGLRKIVKNFVQHESIFAIRSFVRSLAVILTESYKVINVIVDMCIQIYAAKDSAEAVSASTRLSASGAKPIITRSHPSMANAKRKSDSVASTRETVATRSMNGIYTNSLHIKTVDDLLKVLDKGTSEHLVLNGIHNLILDTQQIMTECANMVFLLEEEIVSQRNPDLFGNVLDFDPNELDEFPVLEAHRRIFDAFIDQASMVGCLTLRSLIGDELNMTQGHRDRYSSITPGGNVLYEASSNKSRTSSAHQSKPVSACSRITSGHSNVRMSAVRDKDRSLNDESSTSNTSSILTDEIKDQEDSP